MLASVCAFGLAGCTYSYSDSGRINTEEVPDASFAVREKHVVGMRMDNYLKFITIEPHVVANSGITYWLFK